MRPVYLDTIARHFPGLKVIGCALGCPWYEEASETLRRHDGVFFDLSGLALRGKDPAFFRGVLGQAQGHVTGAGHESSAWSNVVFGTGLRHEAMASVERDYQRLFRALTLPEDVVADIMWGNAACMLGL